MAPSNSAWIVDDSIKLQKCVSIHSQMFQLVMINFTTVSSLLVPMAEKDKEKQRLLSDPANTNLT